VKGVQHALLKEWRLVEAEIAAMDVRNWSDIAAL
jgi:hypothetical protein